MTAIDYFAWIVFVVILISVLAAIVVLAQLPGRMARANGHPQADAINLAGWLGLLFTGGIGWVVAMVWSKTQPAKEADATELTALQARIDELESQLAERREATS